YQICKGFLSGVQEGLGLNALNSTTAAFMAAIGISIVVGKNICVFHGVRIIRNIYFALILK
ncbi:MAG: hypothetical protein Q4D32_04945, partial [Eubacteriales bacterium]|nr:hypothetical protein [Eubacteriales bacterium]